MEKMEKEKRPRCPIGLHNKILNEIEYCHTHKYKWRQWLHHRHCISLGCQYAQRGYGVWGGKFDTRDAKIIG